MKADTLTKRRSKPRAPEAGEMISLQRKTYLASLYVDVEFDHAEMRYIHDRVHGTSVVLSDAQATALTEAFAEYEARIAPDPPSLDFVLSALDILDRSGALVTDPSKWSLV